MFFTGDLPFFPHRRQRSRWLLRAVLPILCFSLCAACAHRPDFAHNVSGLAPLQLADKVVHVADVTEAIETPALLAVDDDMRNFVQRFTEGVPRGRARVLSLHRAIRGATLGISYDPEAGGTAQDVFHRGSANCLSYATLFVALAREAGLDARFQWLRERPQWTRQGERIMVRLHVNALVRAKRGEEYMVDIDPLPTRDIAGSQGLSDADAMALHHANIAMYLLADNRVEDAWLHSVRALQFSPSLALLWVNIGAIYRHSGQHREAERSYHLALELDPWNDSAMNNLVVLFRIEGREEERELWANRVESYRQSNPYFFGWLGDQAADDKDWPQARDHYEKALSLLPQDAALLYALGVVHFELQEVELATDYIRRAIEYATLRSDIDAYRLQLQRVENSR